jgi:single-stranded-DNA-specific exonuclease
MKWNKKDIDPAIVRDLAKRFSCDLITASIFARRSLTKAQDLLFYIEEDPRFLRNPFLLPDMEDAVDRVLAAIEEGERVLVFGDRDVDGITSTVILVQALQDAGLDVRWQLPLGEENYGLSIEAVDNFAKDYGSLIITVDAGISNFKEIEYAQSLGIDTLVLDHHNVPEGESAAVAIVNPKRMEKDYPFRDIAACAIAWKFANALRFARKSDLYNQDICLLNCMPTNEAWIIEAVHLRNLVPIKLLQEHIVPGMVQIEQTRLKDFLAGQQILVWDADIQAKALAKIFGPAIEFNLMGMEGEISKEIPALTGKSLLKIKTISKIARYEDRQLSELDVFINLFTTFVHRRENMYSAQDIQDIQLVGLGTLADLMPLRDENRILVRAGLKAISKGPRPGLSELLLKLGLAGRKISTQEVSWHIAPAINASGRMGQADVAVRLLLSPDSLEREELAGQIIGFNEERKQIGSEAWLIAESRARENLPAFHEKLLIAHGQDIHRGVTGIIANRLSKQFKLPSIVISLGQETSSASLRSVADYDLRGILDQCKDLLEDSGGHSFAAGFSFKTENLDALLKRLADIAISIEFDSSCQEECINIDAELPPKHLKPEIMAIMEKFEPYGQDNAPLTFLSRELKVEDIQLMGKSEVRHVKLSLNTGANRWPAIWWQASDKVKRVFDVKDKVDIVYKLSMNFFNGSETPQLIIQDLQRS